MATAEHKHLNRPDETREFPKGKLDLVTLEGGTIGRLTLEPGWRWSDHVKPIAKTELCEAPHFQYQVSGRLLIKMHDGAEFESGPGDGASLPSGREPWVVGHEPAVLVDWYGASNYAKG